MSRGYGLSHVMATSMLALFASGAVRAEPTTPSEVKPIAALEQPADAAAAAPVASEPAAEVAPAPADAPKDGPAPAPAAVSPPPAAATPPAAVAAPVAPATADPVVEAVAARLKNPVAGVEKADIAALTAFYAKRSSPLFVANGAFTPVAEAIVAELARSDDWGLPSKLYSVTRPTSADPAALAEAEVSVATSALRYARHASGGRIDPASLSRYNDMRGTFADPDDVLAGIASTDKPAQYLLSLHPQHSQYQLLHQALVKLRQDKAPSPEPAATVVDPVPANGPTLKVGVKHPDVIAIRARLAVADDAGSDAYDETVAGAVKAFQAEKGIRATGVVNNATRAALAGGEVKRKSTDTSRDAERIALNLERWRWVPRDLGQFHIMNNVPEFTTRVFKDGQIVHKERIIVGKTNTPTPVFSANMQFVIFHPEWGVPDSIKVKEIWPSLRRKASDDLFGSSSDTRVLQRHNMRVAYNGRVVDASKIDWTTADPRQYSFIQAAGGGNVLGVVKFRFPNRHDVYMHDTPERSLFQNAVRAYSHGCMRVNNPRRLAEVILAEAESPAWTPDKVGNAIAAKGTQEVKLDKPFPVHVVYLTARVDEATGKLETFADLYGQDSRLASAMAGKAVSLEPVETKDAVSAEVRKQVSKKGQKQDADPISSFLSGIFAN